MQHSFDIDIATKYGMDIAIIYNFFISFHSHALNTDNSWPTESHCYKEFPYWTAYFIKKLIAKLLSTDLIK